MGGVSKYGVTADCGKVWSKDVGEAQDGGVGSPLVSWEVAMLGMAAADGQLEVKMPLPKINQG